MLKPASIKVIPALVPVIAEYKKECALRNVKPEALYINKDEFDRLCFEVWSKTHSSLPIWNDGIFIGTVFGIEIYSLEADP